MISMKFLSELGSCYRPSPEDTSGDERSCSAATRPSRGGHWRPNLSAISEEWKSPSREKKKSPPPGRGGSASKPRRHVTHNNHNNNQRDSNLVHVAVPMFAPAPFVF